MSRDLGPLVSRLDHERERFVAAMDRLPRAVRAARPGAEAWSPLEIAEHVFLAERAMLRGLRRQVEAGEARRDIGRASRWKAVALMAVTRAPVKVRAPKQAPIHPTGETPWETLRAEWTALGAGWRALAEAFPPALERAALVRHPVAGPLTTASTLRFLAAHAARHFGQLKRTSTALRTLA
ncbi:MAG TPA: DinB family protein [Rubricoccaceae bacterium]|nr:DinB family protein [Rubricoccaceae bacterium]